MGQLGRPRVVSKFTIRLPIVFLWIVNSRAFHDLCCLSPSPQVTLRLSQSVTGHFVTLIKRSVCVHLINCNSGDIWTNFLKFNTRSNTRKSVSSDIQTLRSWLKKLGCASFFQPTSPCLYIWWNALPRAWPFYDTILLSIRRRPRKTDVNLFFHRNNK